LQRCPEAVGGGSVKADGKLVAAGQLRDVATDNVDFALAQYQE